MGSEIKASAAETKARYFFLICTTIVYVAVFLHYSGLFCPPASSPDSDSYLEVAQKNIFSLDFWASEKAPLVPLLYKFLNFEPQLIKLAQVLISLICWWFLAFQIYLSFERKNVGRIGFILFLYLPLWVEIFNWNSLLQSESLMLSCFALLVGAWLQLVRRFEWPQIVSVVMATLLFGLVRDLNYFLVLMSAIITFLFFLIQRNNKYLVLSIFLGSVFFFCSSLAQSSKRWEFSFYNLLGQRILTDPMATDFFVQKGMPSPPELTKMAGAWAKTDNFAFIKKTELKELRDWSKEKAQIVYREYLLWNWRRSLSEPLQHFNALFFPNRIKFNAIDGEPCYLNNLNFFFELPTSLLSHYYISLILILIFSLIALFFTCQTHKWVLLTVIALLYPQAFLVWHGDAMEIARHAVLLKASLVTGFFGLTLCVLNLFENKPAN